MKLALRVAAFTLVVAAGVAGNTLAANSASAASIPRHNAVTSNTPVPMCNPFTQKCPNIR